MARPQKPQNQGCVNQRLRGEQGSCPKSGPGDRERWRRSRAAEAQLTAVDIEAVGEGGRDGLDARNLDAIFEARVRRGDVSDWVGKLGGAYRTLRTDRAPADAVVVGGTGLRKRVIPRDAPYGRPDRGNDDTGRVGMRRLVSPARAAHCDAVLPRRIAALDLVKVRAHGGVPLETLRARTLQALPACAACRTAHIK